MAAAVSYVPPPPLSPRQAELLDLVIDSILSDGFAPTIREAAKKLRVKSSNTVSDMLNVLAKKGYVSIRFGEARGIKVLRMANGYEARLAFVSHTGNPSIRKW